MFAKLGYASESDRKNDEFVREALHVDFITVFELTEILSVIDLVRFVLSNWSYSYCILSFIMKRFSL